MIARGVGCNRLLGRLFEMCRPLNDEFVQLGRETRASHPLRSLNVKPWTSPLSGNGSI
jgi:hypothetical protein